MRNMDSLKEKLSISEIYSLQELVSFNLNRKQVNRLVQAGVLTNSGVGLYQRSDRPVGPNDDLLLIAKRHPGAVFNLYSAAKHWDITQVESDHIWVAVDASRGKRLSMGTNFYMPIKTLLCKREADLTIGVERVDVGGGQVCMTNPERTVLDMWRMSALSGFRRLDQIEVRDETMYQCIAAYLERYNGEVARLAETMVQLELPEATSNRFMDFLKTYSNGFGALKAF